MPLDNEQIAEIRRLLESKRDTLLGITAPEKTEKGAKKTAKKKKTKKKTAKKAKKTRRRKNPTLLHGNTVG